jgi:NMD protein affecting ribosome stability and mRNA decay
MCLVKRIAAGIHVIDPLTGERAEINCEKYWRKEFRSVMNSRQLTRYVVYVVMEIEHILMLYVVCCMFVLNPLYAAYAVYHTYYPLYAV